MTLDRIAAVTTFLAAVALSRANSRHIGRLGAGIVRAQLTFSRRQFQAVVDRWSDEDLAGFRAHFPLDDALLVAYGLFGWFFARAILDGPAPAGANAFIPWLLPAAAVCDAVENLLERRFVRPDEPLAADVWYAAAGTAAAFKWILITLFVVCMVWAAIAGPRAR